MNSTQSEALTVLLEKHAHTFAKRFASEQANPQKGKQVYLNTLAVYAVHSYLKWLDIKTNLDRGESWNAGLRATFNVADLVLPGVGKLECCPVLSGDEILMIADEVLDDRIGYVVVQFDDDLNQAQLLGFVPNRKLSQPPKPIPLNHLQSLDELIDTIAWHERWAKLWGTLEKWQPAELLYAQSMGARFANKLASSPTRATGIRSALSERSITRGKLVTLRSESASEISSSLDFPTFDSTLNEDQNLLLTLSVSDRSLEEIDISLRIYPYGEVEHLPTGLQIAVIDETGTPQMNAQARDADDWIQLEFSCQPDETFSVQIDLGNQTLIEQFTV
ncbi:MAG: DUF1822 family protein [Microcoleaceae cyanobacterium]